MVSLFETCVTGSVFALAAVIIRLLAGRRLPQFFYYWLWNITLTVLLIPIRPTSPLSVYNLLGHKLNGEFYITAANTSASELLTTQAPGIAAVSQSSWPRLLPVIWLAGAAACGLYFIVNRIYWLVKLRSLRLSAAETVLDGKAYKLKLSDCVDSPCVFGLTGEKIIFPCGWDFSDGPATELALRHELYHIRHFDNLRKCALTLLACLHWFNPIVWLVFALANRDMELYCDCCVVEDIQDELRAVYAGMLLRQGTSSPAAAAARLFPSQKSVLKERIVSIMTSKKPKILLIAACIACLIIIFSAFATTSTPLIYPRDELPLCEAPTMTPEISHVEPPDIAYDNVDNGKKNFTYSDEPINIKNGETLLFDTDIVNTPSRQLTVITVPVEELDNGQIVQYGYVIDGKCVEAGTEKLRNSNTLTFPTPDVEAERCFIRNYSTDTLHILYIK